MPALNETAAIFRFGLLHGLVSASEVIAWADALIESQAEPHPDLIEVALGGSGGPVRLIDELKPLASGCRDEDIVEGILGLMYRALASDPNLARHIARTLYSMAVSGLHPGGEEVLMWMFHFDDAFALAGDHGYGTIEETTHEMLQFLAPYAVPAADPSTATDP